MLSLGATLLTHYPSYDTPAGSVLLSAFLVAVGIVPLAFLAGLLRTRLHRSAVADLVVELGSPLPPDAGPRRDRAHARRPVARARLLAPGRRALRRPRRTGARPRRGARPCGTVLEHDGNAPRGASSTTRRCSTTPSSSRRSALAASLALENSRLQAELRAQLAEVRASRARIVEAGDAERRRLERDLHDGAQQRLLGIRLALQLARGRLADGGAAVDELLAEADAEVVGALDELRALARGIHPAILTEEGLAAALAALARRAPVPVELHRLPGAAARAGRGDRLLRRRRSARQRRQARPRLPRRRSTSRAPTAALAIEVTDDGVGGADADGAGLRGLRDRVEALDGRLRGRQPSRPAAHGSRRRSRARDPRRRRRRHPRGPRTTARRARHRRRRPKSGTAEELLQARRRRPARRRRRSTSACRPPTRTKGCSPPSRSARRYPEWPPSSSPNTSTSTTRSSSSPGRPSGSATCSRTGSPTSPTFVAALEQVAAGGTVVEPSLVDELLGAPAARDPLAELTAARARRARADRRRARPTAASPRSSSSPARRSKRTCAASSASSTSLPTPARTGASTPCSPSSGPATRREPDDAKSGVFIDAGRRAPALTSPACTTTSRTRCGSKSGPSP